MAPPPEDQPSTRTQRLVAWAAWAALRTLSALPLWLGYALADLVAPLLVLFTLQHERKVRHKGRGLFRNQRIVFRDAWTPELSRRLLWGWARHMTRLVVDFARIQVLDAKAMRACFDMRELAKVRDLRARGQGVICLTGHIGVWELSGHLAAVSGWTITSIARPPKNHALSDVGNAIRGSGGQIVLAKWGVLRPIFKGLRRGELAGVIADENARTNPVFVPFLGTLAATNRAPALIHLKTGAPIAVVSVARLERGRFRFHVWDVIEPRPSSGSREVDVERVARRINDGLSRAILAYPEQWLWGMRRYHTRPPGEVLGPDGLPPVAPDGPQEAYPPGYDAAPGQARGAISLH